MPMTYFPGADATDARTGLIQGTTFEARWRNLQRMTATHQPWRTPMTPERMQIINAVTDGDIDAARVALPSGDDRELAEWILTHRPLPPEIDAAFADLGLKELIRERARKLGVTLRA